VRCGDATRPGALGDASVVFCSLLPDGLALLLPALREVLDRGSRLLILHFALPELSADLVARDEEHRLFLYQRSAQSAPAEAVA